MLLGTNAQAARRAASTGLPWEDDTVANPVLPTVPAPSSPAPPAAPSQLAPPAPPLKQVVPPTIDPIQAGNLAVSQAKEAREASMQPTQMLQAQTTIAKTQQELDDLKAKDAERQANETSGLLDGARNVLRAGTSALKNIGPNGWWATGITGQMGKMVAGSPANDLRSEIATLKSNLAFSELQKMRQSSPTGGAVGNVSDADMALLASRTAALDPDKMSAQELTSNVKYIMDGYRNMLTRMGYKSADYEPPENAAATSDTKTPAAIPGATPATPGGGIGGGPGGVPDPRAPGSLPGGPSQVLSMKELAAGAGATPAAQGAPDFALAAARDRAEAFGKILGFDPAATASAALDRATGVTKDGLPEIPISYDPYAIYPIDPKQSAEGIANQKEVNAAAQANRDKWLLDNPGKTPPWTQPQAPGPLSPEEAANKKALDEAKTPWHPAVEGEPNDGRADPTSMAYVRGALDVPMMGFRDEAAAGLEHLFTGRPYVDAVLEQRANDAADQAVHPWARFLGGATGGIALPIGRTESVGRTALEGAAAAGAYGAGSANPDPNLSLADSLLQRGANVPVNAAVGGLTAGGLARIGAGIGTKAAARRDIARDALPTIFASDAENVPIIAPHVDPTMRGKFAGVESSTGGGDIARAAMRDTNNAIGDRVQQVLGSNGPDAYALGDQTKGAIQRDIKATKAARDAAYAAVDEAAGGQTITPHEAVAKIDQHIAELMDAPETNASKIKVLESIKADMVAPQEVPTGEPPPTPPAPPAPTLLQRLSSIFGRGAPEAAAAEPAAAPTETQILPKDMTFQGMQNVESAMKERARAANKDLTSPDIVRRVGEVGQALKSDAEAQLSPDALDKYNEANALNRDRAANIQQNYAPVVGGRDTQEFANEKVTERLLAAARRKGGNIDQLRAITGVMTPAEKSGLGAHIADTLGFDGEGGFSAAKFLTEIQKYSPAALQEIYGDAGATTVANLKRLARAQRDLSASLNTSRTAGARNWNERVRALFGNVVSQGGGALLGGGTTGTTAGAIAGAAIGQGVKNAAMDQFTALRASQMTNPKILRELVRAADANTSAKRAIVVQRLAQLAARNPEMKDDVMPIWNALNGAQGDDSQQ